MSNLKAKSKAGENSSKKELDIMLGKVIKANQVERAQSIPKFEFSVFKKSISGTRNKTITAKLKASEISNFDFGSQNPVGVRHILNLDLEEQNNGKFSITFDAKSEKGSYLTIKLPSSAKIQSKVISPKAYSRLFYLENNELFELI